MDSLSPPPKPQTVSHLLLLIEKIRESECPVPRAKRSGQLFPGPPKCVLDEFSSAVVG